MNENDGDEFEDGEDDEWEDEWEDEDEFEELPDEAHLVPAGERGSAGRARPTG